MIAGIGTDILAIARMRKAWQRTPGLAKRILTPPELSLCLKSSDPALFLAKRFAAKEAVVKALGTGIGRGVSWQHIELEKSAAGQPLVHLSGGAAARAELLQLRGIHISYSDEKEYVIAFAVAEKK